MRIPDDCYPWEPGGCAWTVQYLWRWMSPFARYDVIVLALMLIYTIAIIIHVGCRYHVAWHSRTDDDAGRKVLPTFLSSKMRSLKSIARTAPYLGLAGTCVGILSALTGGSMERDALRAVIATRIGAALITTAAAIPVAVLATCSHNYLCGCMDLLAVEVCSERLQRGRHFRGARRLLLTKRFSELSAFGLITVPVLALAITGYMTFASFHLPTGVYVTLPARSSASKCGDRDPVVLQLLSDRSFTINSERVPINLLRGRLGEIFRGRTDRILYFRADPEVDLQEAIRTIGISQDAVSNLYVALLTPATEKESCPDIPMPRELHKIPQ